jgi:hypothetical protein
MHDLLDWVGRGPLQGAALQTITALTSAPVWPAKGAAALILGTVLIPHISRTDWVQDPITPDLDVRGGKPVIRSTSVLTY